MDDLKDIPIPKKFADFILWEKSIHDQQWDLEETLHHLRIKEWLPGALEHKNLPKQWAQLLDKEVKQEKVSGWEAALLLFVALSDLDPWPFSVLETRLINYGCFYNNFPLLNHPGTQTKVEIQKEGPLSTKKTKFWQRYYDNRYRRTAWWFGYEIYQRYLCRLTFCAK